MNEEKRKIEMDDGNWYAVTMGVFLQLLVDTGHDPAVIFRVVEDTRVDEKSFIRRLEIVQVPNGAVADTINKMDVEGIHDLLINLMKKGLIK